MEGHNKSERRPGPEARSSAGFSLLELLLVVSVFVIALLAFSQSMGYAVRLTTMNRETGLAADAAREMIEQLQGSEDFTLVFALYNSDPGDDPGPGAPGAGFAVFGLDPADDDPDGLVGEIRFPTIVNGGVLELREDVEDPILGMPRDLDGSGAIDDEDQDDDYMLLPVSLTLRWKGRSGVRTMEVQTLLADR